jgi:2-amino-4-hydroxy-6-hydroxymethyldihydropteridine diphosphokinase
MFDVYVGLGSNLDPERRLRQAVDALEWRCGPLRVSAVYRSPAAGAPAADYANLVVAFRSEAGAPAIKEMLSAIETAAGRLRTEPRPAACALDLDLLLYGHRVDAQQRLPRADILRHAFVLAPLAQIAAQLIHPVTGQGYGAAWQALAATAPPLTKLGDLRR